MFYSTVNQKDNSLGCDFLRISEWVILMSEQVYGGMFNVNHFSVCVTNIDCARAS